MHTSDFDYHLPAELIAQEPAEPRDSARLLVLDRGRGTISHHVFGELPDLLQPDDVLIANDSRVLPARLLGRRVPRQAGDPAATAQAPRTSAQAQVPGSPAVPAPGERQPAMGGAVEALLLREVGRDEWMALVRPARRIRPGDRLAFDGGALVAEVVERLEGAERRLRLHAAQGTSRDAIHRAGVAPLPPYIHAPLADPERYQTVYARVEGSVAAPTAGLHFTPGLLDRLRERGITMCHLTLHVGAGTFKPVQGEDVAAHRMHPEWAHLDAETATFLRAMRAQGRRIVAVGTTSVRVLEAAARDGVLRPFSGWTNIFITPGHPFRATDAMITNFHLPRSTLLMLVSAFAGKNLIDRAYAEAIARRYRFYSFGDAMLIT